MSIDRLVAMVTRKRDQVTIAITRLPLVRNGRTKRGSVRGDCIVGSVDVLVLLLFLVDAGFVARPEGAASRRAVAHLDVLELTVHWLSCK